MAKFLTAFFTLTAIAFAHVISMSTGDAVVDGPRIEYVLRMPVYEVQKGIDPAKSLLDRVTFQSGGEKARRLDGECHLDQSQGQYLCAADYAFSQAPRAAIEVKCTFYEVTAANHVHMLRAKRNGEFDQAILDATLPSASLTFRPPSAFEIAAAQITSGFFRTFTSVAQILLLAALVLASRNWKDTWLVALSYFGGECIVALGVARISWQSSPRFTEAAVALALAYLGVELLAWPQAGGRWLLALLFGGFGGLYFASFLNDSGYRPDFVLSGSVVAGALLITLCAMLKHATLRQAWLKPQWIAIAGRTAAAALVASGTVWFLIRLRS